VPRRNEYGAGDRGRPRAYQPHAPRHGRRRRLRPRNGNRRLPHLDRNNPESGNVTALKQFDTNLVLRPVGLVVGAKTSPQAAGFYPDDRIDLRVIVLVSLIDFGANQVLLDVVRFAAQRLFDHQPEEG
jgi:hypothetical protein